MKDQTQTPQSKRRFSPQELVRLETWFGRLSVVRNMLTGLTKSIETMYHTGALDAETDPDAFYERFDHTAELMEAVADAMKTVEADNLLYTITGKPAEYYYFRSKIRDGEYSREFLATEIFSLKNDPKFAVDDLDELKQYLETHYRERSRK